LKIGLLITISILIKWLRIYLKKLHECVCEIATTKVVSVHSRPWIDRDISDQLKLLWQLRRKCRLRRSQANVEKYHEMQKSTMELIQKVESEWWQAQCDQLIRLSEFDKWKLINTNKPVELYRSAANQKV